MPDMDEKRLSALTANINIIEKRGGDPLISGIAYDSRMVKKGFLFCALDGLHVDGHSYISKAIGLGAAAVLHSRALDEYDENITYIMTDNPRTAMASLSAAFYGNPADKLITVGVTGTDGKTTTVYLIDQLIELCGLKSGFISTAACKIADEITKNPYRQSTPEATEIQMMLSQMLENGKTHAVVEATSHGLSPKNNRLGNLDFNAAVFTNLTHEHLEFHGSFEQYRKDKTELFRKLKMNTKKQSFGVVNLDDGSSAAFIEATQNRVYTCSTLNPEADYFADEIRQEPTGNQFRLNIRKDGKTQSFQTSIQLPGLFNIENVLGAFAVIHNLTPISPAHLAGLLPKLQAVKGRMKLITGRQSFTVIVDYAHSPGSFRKVFPVFRENCRGRLISVFGSAGERDIEKRSIQGAIAAEYSDILFITDEDPRGEVPMDIIRQIAAGAEGKSEEPVSTPKTEGDNLFLIPDRKTAILEAFKTACEGDTVVLLGKGHESTIIYADGPIDWDEQTAAEEALRELGY